MGASQEVIRRVDGGGSLEVLQMIIEQQEQELGPLVALGNDGTDTIITFDQGQDLPGMDVELAVSAGQTVPPGFQLVVRGECIVGGIKASLAALRPVATGLLQSPASQLIPEEPGAAPTSPPLGRLSIKYETGGRGPGTVSSGIGDAGGVSYGSYQMTSSPNGGSVIRFVTIPDFNWRADFAGSSPGSSEFTAIWKKIAADQPEAFQAAQHEFIKRTHFDPLVKRTKDSCGLDAVRRSAALQDVVWSTAVQHGPNTVVISRVMASIPEASSVADNDKGFDRQLIISIYDERGRRAADGTLVYFSKNSPGVQASVSRRFVRERQDALAVLDASA